MRLLAAILVITLAPTIGSSKERQRQWQTGMVLDTNRDRNYAGSSSNGHDAGANTYGTSIALYRSYETYAIDAGDYIYVCEERVHKKSSPALTVNASVQFVIEKDRIYFKGEDGKEHETRITKKVLKVPPPSPPKD